MQLSWWLSISAVDITVLTKSFQNVYLLSLNESIKYIMSFLHFLIQWAWIIKLLWKKNTRYLLHLKRMDCPCLITVSYARTLSSILRCTPVFPLSDKFVVREYDMIVPPFHCHMPVTSVHTTDSMLECGILCSLQDKCIMYGYNSSAPWGANQPGLCALTSFGGTPVTTSFLFNWYAPIWWHSWHYYVFKNIWTGGSLLLGIMRIQILLNLLLFNGSRAVWDKYYGYIYIVSTNTSICSQAQDF